MYRQYVYVMLYLTDIFFNEVGGAGKVRGENAGRQSMGTRVYNDLLMTLCVYLCM